MDATLKRYQEMEKREAERCREAGPCMWCRKWCPADTRRVFSLIDWFFCPTCLADAEIRCQIEEMHKRASG